jgi:type IX secretion system PorP/SprF family membrane protein
MRHSDTRFLAFLLVLSSACSNLSAQQDAMFTKYMFNTLVYNPAYAGSFDYLSVNALYRNQWFGIEGAPVTQTLSIHSPLNERVGLGFSLINDQVGPTGSTQANAVYAYRFPVGPGKLAISLQAGIMNWRADWSKLSLHDATPDQSFQDVNPSRWLPNFGAGMYYQTNHWFLGFSSPHLVNYDLRKKQPGEPDDLPSASLYRHYYAFGGVALPLRGEALVFRPSFLFKRVGLFGDARNARGRISAPSELDLDLAFFFHQRLWLGASYRTAVEAITDRSSSVDSGDIWAAFHFRNGLRIGLAYDYTLSRLQTVAPGSMEIMLGYELDYRVNKVVTPRYF